MRVVKQKQSGLETNKTDGVNKRIIQSSSVGNAVKMYPGIIIVNKLYAINPEAQLQTH